MKEISIPLRGEFIELCTLLKLAGTAVSGGQGKQFVAEGLVTVDGLPETRMRAKIRHGQVVRCLDSRITVNAA